MKILNLLIALSFFSTTTTFAQTQYPPMGTQPIQMVPQTTTNPGIAAAAQQQRDSAEKGAQMNQMIGYAMLGICAVAMVSSMSGGQSGGGQGGQQGGASKGGQPSQSGGSGGGGGGMNMMMSLLPCMIGAILLVQADSLKKDAAAAYQTSMATATQTTYVPAAQPQVPMPANAAAGMNYLNNAGYRVSSSGVTTPDGRVIPASSFSTGSGLSNFGVSRTAFQDMQDMQAKLRKQAVRNLASVDGK